MASLPDFIVFKYNLYFNLYDFDSDGLMSFYDYLALVNRLADINGWDMQGALYWSLYDDTVRNWRTIEAFSSRSDELVDLRDWLEYASFLICARKTFTPALHAGQNLTFNAIYNTLDPKDTGYIHGVDWSNFTAAWGILGNPQKMFQRIDTDDDGILSRAAFVELFDQFLFGNDPRQPGNYILGDIPDYRSSQVSL